MAPGAVTTLAAFVSISAGIGYPVVFAVVGVEAGVH